MTTTVSPYRLLCSSFVMMIFLLASTTTAQRMLDGQAPANPLTGVDGQRRIPFSSPRDGPVEREFIGGWQQSPFPSCPAGTWPTTSLLSPDGCEGCPRGRIATSLYLQSVEDCKMCPPGQYNDKKGAFIVGIGEEGALAVDCTPCPANTFGAVPGQESRECSARCPVGTYTRGEGGKTRRSDCIDCPTGYNGGSGQCLARATTRQREEERKAREAADAAAQSLAPGQRVQSTEYIRLQSSKSGAYQQQQRRQQGQPGLPGSIGLNW
jgi:hypothetical protein